MQTISQPEHPPFQFRVTFTDGYLVLTHWKAAYASVQGREWRGWHYVPCAKAKVRKDGQLGRVTNFSPDDAEWAYSELYRAWFTWDGAGRPTPFVLQDGCTILREAA